MFVNVLLPTESYMETLTSFTPGGRGYATQVTMTLHDISGFESQWLILYRSQWTWFRKAAHSYKGLPSHAGLTCKGLEKKREKLTEKKYITSLNLCFTSSTVQMTRILLQISHFYNCISEMKGNTLRLISQSAAAVLFHASYGTMDPCWSFPFA